jgi:hypothetical protein
VQDGRTAHRADAPGLGICRIVTLPTRRLRNACTRLADFTVDVRWDETWHRLLEWTSGQGPAERLAAQVHLTRARTAITRERAREAQRLEKLLEDAGIKPSRGRFRNPRGIRAGDAGGPDRRR